MNKETKNNTIIEMREHLEHILSDINKILEEHINKYTIDNINEIKLIIIDLKEKITNREDLLF